MRIIAKFKDPIEYKACQEAARMAGLTERQWARAACLQEVYRLQDIIKQRQLEAAEKAKQDVADTSKASQAKETCSEDNLDVSDESETSEASSEQLPDSDAGRQATDGPEDDTGRQEGDTVGEEMGEQLELDTSIGAVDE